MKKFLLFIVFILSFTIAYAGPSVNDKIKMSVIDSAYIMTNQSNLGDWFEVQTFCLEYHEYFNPGIVYNVNSVDDYANYGGKNNDINKE